jgi:hypothetical protein
MDSLYRVKRRTRLGDWWELADQSSGMSRRRSEPGGTCHAETQKRGLVRKEREKELSLFVANQRVD